MTRLLSSHAEDLFTLARRIERAESLARVIGVNASVQPAASSPAQAAGGLDWAWFVSLHEDEAVFAERFPAATSDSLCRFYIRSADSPRSVCAAMRAANASARALRPLIPEEVLHSLARFHDWLQSLDETAFAPGQLPRACDSIRRRCHALLGMMDGSFYRDDAWAFFSLGLQVERMSQTCRILNMGSIPWRAGPSRPAADPDFAFRLWTAALCFTSAYDAFRRLHPGAFEAAAAARFLVCDARLPRSTAACAGEMQRLVNHLRASFQLRNAVPASKRIEALLERIETARREADISLGIDALARQLQNGLDLLSNDLAVTFFGRPSLAASPSTASAPL